MIVFIKGKFRRGMRKTVHISYVLYAFETYVKLF